MSVVFAALVHCALRIPSFVRLELYLSQKEESVRKQIRDSRILWCASTWIATVFLWIPDPPDLSQQQVGWAMVTGSMFIASFMIFIVYTRPSNLKDGSEWPVFDSRLIPWSLAPSFWNLIVFFSLVFELILTADFEMAGT